MHLYEMMRMYLPDCNDYIKFDAKRSIWADLAEVIIKQTPETYRKLVGLTKFRNGDESSNEN